MRVYTLGTWSVPEIPSCRSCRNSLLRLLVATAVRAVFDAAVPVFGYVETKQGLFRVPNVICANPLWQFCQKVGLMITDYFVG